MRSKTWILLAVVLGSGIVFLDSTVVNVALPQIGKELSSSLLDTLEAQSYVYYGYLLTLSSLLILAGALTDYFGRRRIFLIGLIGFGSTSVLCGLAPNMELLIVFRVLQGAAGAVLVPGSLSIITATFQGEEQGRAFGIWAGASAFTSILGPVIGGALVTYVSWRAAFLINVPLVILAAYATIAHVPETRDESAGGNFDWLGAVVAAVAVGGLTFGTIRGQAQDWKEVTAFVALGLGAMATIAFPILMKRSPNPLVPLSLFQSRNFTVTNIATFLIYGAIYVNLYLLPLFLIGVAGYNALAAGEALIPGILFLALFSAKFGALAVRYGPRLFMTVGPALMGTGLLWLARIPPDTDAWVAELERPSSLLPPSGYATDVLPALIIFGIGLMIMVAPLTATLMRSVPPRHSGVASAVNNAISRIGPQLAGALLFVAISATFYAGIAERVPGVDSSSSRLHDQVSPLNAPPNDVPDEVARAARESSTDAFHLAMLVAALLCYAGAAVNGVGIDNAQAKHAGETGEAVPSEAH
jgi:EmrB/QacA subfamily drug resistance transporter